MLAYAGFLEWRQKWFPMSSRGPAFERLVAFHNESLACSSFFSVCFFFFFFVGEGEGFVLSMWITLDWDCKFFSI